MRLLRGLLGLVVHRRLEDQQFFNKTIPQHLSSFYASRSELSVTSSSSSSSSAHLAGHREMASRHLHSQAARRSSGPNTRSSMLKAHMDVGITSCLWDVIPGHILSSAAHCEKSWITWSRHASCGSLSRSETLQCAPGSITLGSRAEITTDSNDILAKYFPKCSKTLLFEI